MLRRGSRCGNLDQRQRIPKRARRGLAVFDQRFRLRQNTDGARCAERDSDQRNERLEHHQQLCASG